MSLKYSKPVKLIVDNAELADYCAHLSKADYICIDTEFMRERTYWPQLCLIQISPPDEWVTAQQGADDWLNAPALIDPLAPNIALDAFFDLLTNRSVLKIFHAARQDLELIWHVTGKLPAPIFDTQLVASVCGYGDQIAYGNLVQTLCDIEIDKSARLTDWMLRPLSNKAKIYALGDVLYLGKIYHILSAEMDKAGRKSWVEEELALLSSPSTYENDPEMAHLRIKKRSGTAKYFHLITRLASWRERIAQQRNIPRQHVIRDDLLIDLASSAPATQADLERLRSVSKGFGGSQLGKEILSAIDDALKMPESQWSKQERPIPLSPQERAIGEMLRLLLKLVALEHGLAARLITNGDMLDQFSRKNPPAELPILKGWRYDIFGKYAQALKQGELFLGIDQTGKIIYTEIPY
ncbi:MAG: ribonuclease D [Alphaproteobacteria bacterium]